MNLARRSWAGVNDHRDSYDKARARSFDPSFKGLISRWNSFARVMFETQCGEIRKGIYETRQ